MKWYDYLYTIERIIPNGCYYVLRGLGRPGEVNYFVNMDRFEPTCWTAIEVDRNHYDLR